MAEESENYCELEVEDDWIAYLRRRLPYSFLKIRRERRRGGGHRYVLSEPELGAGAEYHNFWRRGYVYYVAGKLTDAYALSGLWTDYRRLLAERTQRGRTGDYPPPLYRAKDYYNAMELEKLWQPIRENHLDRERVAMTNMSQAMELCLKAVKAHAEYRERGRFMFEDGHDIGMIFDSLPEPLQIFIVDESRVFAREYREFRSAVEAGVKRLDETPRTEWNWEKVGLRLEGTAYTAILEMNDPWPKTEDWFGTAMDELRDLAYHRYSPDEGLDLYPVEHINAGLLIGRFLYEHLFPVPSAGRGSTVARSFGTDVGVVKSGGNPPPGEFFPRG